MAQPFVRTFHQRLHICIAKVVQPSYDVIPKSLFPLWITPSVASTSQFPELVLHFGLRFRVKSQPAFTFASIKAVSEIFHLADVCDLRFLKIDFQEKFLRNVWHDMLQRSLCALLRFTEYHAVVGIAHKPVSSSLQFLIQLI